MLLLVHMSAVCCDTTVMWQSCWSVPGPQQWALLRHCQSRRHCVWLRPDSA